MPFDLTTTNLVLNDLTERERSRQVSLNASFNNSGPPSSGNTPPPINSTDSGGSEFNVAGVGGSFSRSALDGTTRATIGAGNVTVTGQSEDETAAQLAEINRDIDSVTTITRDTSFDTGNVFIDVGAARRAEGNKDRIDNYRRTVRTDDIRAIQTVQLRTFNNNVADTFVGVLDDQIKGLANITVEEAALFEIPEDELTRKQAEQLAILRITHIETYPSQAGDLYRDLQEAGDDFLLDLNANLLHSIFDARNSQLTRELNNQDAIREWEAGIQEWAAANDGITVFDFDAETGSFIITQEDAGRRRENGELFAGETSDGFFRYTPSADGGDPAIVRLGQYIDPQTGDYDYVVSAAGIGNLEAATNGVKAFNEILPVEIVGRITRHLHTVEDVVTVTAQRQGPRLSGAVGRIVNGLREALRRGDGSVDDAVDELPNNPRASGVEGGSIHRLGDNHPLKETAIPRDGDRLVLNQTGQTCGHNFCAMTLDTLNRSTSADELINLIPPNSDGITSLDVADLFQSQGVTANHLSRQNIDDLNRLTANGNPIVAHIDIPNGNTGHFVVIDGITQRNGRRVVAVRDPQGAQFFSPVEDFIRVFSGFVVEPVK